MIKKTLYFGQPSRLSIRNSQLMIERQGSSGQDVKIESVPAEDIGVMVLDHQQISVTQSVFQVLLGNNCTILICDEKHMPQGLINPLEGNTTQSERYRFQIEATVPLKKQLWQQTVVAKIMNQAALLACSGVYHLNMLRWAKDVKSGDSANHEARSAAYYWDHIFTGQFKRHRKGEVPNNLLNYGYAILRAVIARSLVISGLLPTLGIHHRNRYNAYCLADDVMEPYRPFVDKIVLEMMQEQKTEIVELTPELKKRLLSVPVADVIIGGQRSPLMIAAQRTTASLASCFSGNLRKIVYPELKYERQTQ